MRTSKSCKKRWTRNPDFPMYKQTKRALLLLTGILFIILGLFGLALPFLQGFLFLTIGFILLSLHSPKIRMWTDVHTVKYPKIHRAIQKIEKWIVGIIGEI